ncbi:unnamed protein product [Blepharisma stoltei]|uniref:Papain family cysteine protease n=1 Tax=Blepharisma stoltei TaxID=1481888 RepID=A0AAU9J1Q2_9CILI|nr:unnamed protein product [Blepharisma stoltei]
MDSFYLADREQTTTKKRKVLLALSLTTLIGIIGTVCLLNTPSSQLALYQYTLEEQEFQKYMEDYGKSYSSHNEYLIRFKNFRENTAFIRVHNMLGRDWTLGVNQFADMSFEEFGQVYLSNSYEVPTLKPEEIEPFDPLLEIPSSVDWRAKGAVTPIKNQGSCGSCWAFSTASGVESIWFISGHPLISLSEQQMVDCAGPWGNYGCYGGNIVYSYPYVVQKGLTTGAAYPYKAAQGSCNTSLESQPAARIKNAYFVQANDYQALLNAVSIRPVSVAVQADQAAWTYYKGGIVTGSCGTSLNHAVNIVGYNIANNPNYWIVRNSWGTWWGESGYIRIKVSSGYGICGINMMPLYPVA